MLPRACSRLVMTVLLLGVSAVRVGGEPAAPHEWGAVKGRVIWSEKTIPKNLPIPGLPPGVGPLLQNKLVIDARSKGVRWVLVWLADPKDARNAKFVPPIHGSYTNPPPDAEIDTPRHEYQPRVLGLWVTQRLTVRNTGPVARSFEMISIGVGPTKKLLLPPKGHATIDGFVPMMIPTPYGSSIHVWMKGYIGTFAHPYFAVTDADGKFEIKNAPAGKFQLILWHEEVGFLTMTSKQLRGKVIEIKDKRVTDVGADGMKADED